jgi:hypothetical protein
MTDFRNKTLHVLFHSFISYYHKEQNEIQTSGSRHVACLHVTEKTTLSSEDFITAQHMSTLQ